MDIKLWHSEEEVKKSETSANHRIKRIIALCTAALGLFGNFVFYLLSRFIEVRVPHITYEKGRNGIPIAAA